MIWIMNVLNLPNPPSSSPSLSLQALCCSCWCLNVSSTGHGEYLMGVSRMGGFTLLQQDLTHANSSRLHITPCYFDPGNKYILFPVSKQQNPESILA